LDKTKTITKIQTVSYTCIVSIGLNVVVFSLKNHVFHIVKSHNVNGKQLK